AAWAHSPARWLNSVFSSGRVMSSAQTRKPFSPSLQVSIRSLRVEITSLVSKVMKLLLLIQQVSGTTNDRAAWVVVQPVLTQHLHRQIICTSREASRPRNVM